MGKRWGWRVCGDHSIALGSQSSLTPRGTESTENLQSQNLSGREVQENHAGWQLHPSGLPGKPALLSAAGFRGLQASWAPRAAQAARRRRTPPADSGSKGPGGKALGGAGDQAKDTA